MRHFAIGILCTAAFFAAGCNKSPEGQAPEAVNAGGNEGAAAAAVEYFTIRAGPIAPAKISALSGNFQMLKVGAGAGIPSPKVGGACIVFSAADLGITKIAGATCNINSDCEDSGVAAYYCHAPTHSCWVRPSTDPKGDDTCNRPIPMTAAVLNPVPKTPITAATATKLGIKAGTRARVVACLNQTGFVRPPNPHPTGCPSIDGPDRIEDFGPVATIHP